MKRPAVIIGLMLAINLYSQPNIRNISFDIDMFNPFIATNGDDFGLEFGTSFYEHRSDYVNLGIGTHYLIFSRFVSEELRPKYSAAFHLPVTAITEPVMGTQLFVSLGPAIGQNTVLIFKTGFKIIIDEGLLCARPLFYKAYLVFNYMVIAHDRWQGCLQTGIGLTL